jgi:hypothetical protein
MRKEVIVLLAATSSIIGNAASQARVTLDLHALEISPHMIIGDGCIGPRNGSALSNYSRTEEPMRSFHDVATPEGVCVSCADFAQEARLADPQEADPTWSACDADGIDDARGLTGKRKPVH